MEYVSHIPAQLCQEVCPGIIYGLKTSCRFPSELWNAWNNDFYKAVSNSVVRGCMAHQASTALLGIGEKNRKYSAGSNGF